MGALHNAAICPFVCLPVCPLHCESIGTHTHIGLLTVGSQKLDYYRHTAVMTASARNGVWRLLTVTVDDAARS